MFCLVSVQCRQVLGYNATFVDFQEMVETTDSGVYCYNPGFSGDDRDYLNLLQIPLRLWY